MDEKNKLFEEQQAPLKNTDKAFVQVGHDGEPVMPKNDREVQKDPANDRPDDQKHR